MPQSEPIAILIVSDHAESIKLVTISLRGFFPGCLVDVAYSSEEARTWTPRREWTIILIDEQCLTEGSRSLHGEIKSHSPYAASILLSDRTESASALQALQADFDFFLAKKSPAFLTELLFCAREAIEKHHLRVTLDYAQERHRRFIELLSDTAYELDAKGCFMMVGPRIVTLLGYSPDELIGLPYSILVPPGQELSARYRLNERRSGARGTSLVELTVQGKTMKHNRPLIITAEVTARGLYDPLRRFVGTVGLIRDLAQSKQQAITIQELRQQLQHADGLLTQAQRVTVLSQQLREPLTSLLTQSQQLLSTIRNTRLEDQVEILTGQAAEAATLGAALAQTLQERTNPSGNRINDILDEIFSSTTPTVVESTGIIRQFGAQLPSVAGDREQVRTLVQHLLSYAQTYLRTIGRGHQLIVSTSTVGPSSISADTPTLFPLTPPTKVEIELLESDRVSLAASPATAPPSTDLLESYQLVRQLDGTLDVSAPMQGPLRMVLRLPVATHPSLEKLQLPIAVSTASPTVPHEATTATVTSIPVADSDRPQQERRHTPRIPTTLPASIALGAAIWQGTISNISLGGTSITLPSNFPTVTPQDAYVVLKTAVGILELHGQTQERAIWPPFGTPVSHLVVIFDLPKREEAAVLTSLIQAAKEGTLPFSLEVLLSTEPQLELPSDTRLLQSEREHFDQRESIRVVLTTPVRLEVTDLTGHLHRLAALTVNFSRDGACLHLNSPPEFMNGLATIHFTAAQSQSHPGTHEPGTPDSPLSARIVWSIPDPTAVNQFRHQGSDPAMLVGIRFHGLTPYAEREVSRVIRQHLMFPSKSEASSPQGSVISVLRECRNPRGQAIVITDDHLHQPLSQNTPVVIIAPGYGQTALDTVALSYYLAYHRLRILRYDHTNHIGLSDGELQQTTLRSMQADLLKVVEFVQHTWPTAPLIVMASDTTARVAIKMAVQARPLDLLLLINPVIDMQAMLMTVHGHDLVADHRYGLRRGITNLLGLNIDVDRFVSDIVTGHFTDLASTIGDLRLLRSPAAILTIPSSPLRQLPPADLPQDFLTALGTHTRLATVPAPLMSQALPLNEPHPVAFREILEQIVATVPLPPVSTEYRARTHQMLAYQQRIELERTRLRHNLSQITRQTLRIAQIQQSAQLGNLHEHWKLLDDLYRLLSPLEPGSMLVDVGVGYGDLVRATMVNQTYRSRQRGWNQEQPAHMIGLEYAQDSLTQARENLRALHQELDSDFAGILTLTPPITTDWIHTDWTDRLPFKDRSIHRIVCNLSLPFVPSPLATIRELYRVLRPQGRLVFTVFHTDSDLSVLYRRHLHRGNQDEFSPQAQLLLQYLGRLREAIRHGLLHTFDRSSLTSFLQKAGIQKPRILPALDGHALLAIIEKDKSAG
ncbi:MAG: methyltransferase domain-containing protein [Nitrospira sp. CG24E]|nr:MAG: methyltransferase domain-containing protein [Nitrospira sp. CG24E]